MIEFLSRYWRGGVGMVQENALRFAVCFYWFAFLQKNLPWHFLVP